MKALVSSALTVLFVTIGPVEVATILLTVTPRASDRDRARVALMATAISMLVLVLFAVGGNKLLGLLGIGLPALRAAGGILLLKIAADLLFQRHSQLSSLTKGEADEALHHSSIAVFPLAIPLIAGPGSITAVILLMGRSESTAEQLVVLACLVTMLLVTLAAMIGAARLIQFLGLTGASVVARVSGMLLAALAVQFIFDGFKEVGLFQR